MARSVKPAAAFLLAAGCMAVTMLSGYLYVQTEGKKLTAMENGDQKLATGQPSDAIRSFLDQIAAKDYTGLFANAQHTDPTMDSEAAYDQALADRFAGIDLSAVIYTPIDTQSEIQTYSLASGTTALGMVKLYRDDSAYQVSLPLTGAQSFTVEVPAGTALYSNGIAVSADQRIAADAPASNFDQVYDDSIIPHVDVYQLNGLLGYPALSDANGTAYALVQDVLTGRLLAGTAVSDAAVKDMIIEDGERLAAYPAMDAGLGSVSEIADHDTLWYQRYVTLQNSWFTEHETSSFSNGQVLAVCRQSDDTMTAHVIFDYYAKNSARQLERTWYIGYQLTFVRSGDQWLICDTEIDNELNPGNVSPE